MKAELLEFLLHGVRFVYPVERGGLTRGLPTAHAAPPLSGRVMISTDERHTRMARSGRYSSG